MNENHCTREFDYKSRKISTQNVKINQLQYIYLLIQIYFQSFLMAIIQYQIFLSNAGDRENIICYYDYETETYFKLILE